MRKFESNQFRLNYIEALNSGIHEYPDQESKEALSYVNQFVDRGSRELLLGYMPERYADALVRYRKHNDSRRLTGAVSTLCVDGKTSKPVSVSSEQKITIPNSRDAISLLGDRYYDTNNSECKKMMRVAQEIIRNNRSDVVLWMPEEIYNSLTNLVEF